MIRSMTGFGTASAQDNGVEFTAELRSLNSRYFKASVRVPEELSGLEAALESALRKRANRGSFTLNVRAQISAEAATNVINDAALMSYLGHLETVRNKINDQSVQIDLTQLLALPGVLQPATDHRSLMETGRRAVPKLLDEALDHLIEMRTVEGRAVASDLLDQRDHIRAQMARIAERAPRVVNEYHDKLATRVSELMAKAKLKVDENDLIREVAVFADRADISEELSRMNGHLDQLGELIEASPAEDPAGRTLDFISQEMLREANTIGSKSNDTAISRAVVEVKSRIDRIKEQVQNVA